MPYLLPSHQAHGGGWASHILDIKLPLAPGCSTRLNALLSAIPPLNGEITRLQLAPRPTLLMDGVVELLISLDYSTAYAPVRPKDTFKRSCQ